MKLFIVTTEGVYRHEILGVFSNVEKARKCAENASEQESDGYHEFHIGIADLDKNITDIEIIEKINEYDT
jgi:hypothetical protein